MIDVTSYTVNKLTELSELEKIIGEYVPQHYDEILDCNTERHPLTDKRYIVRIEFLSIEGLMDFDKWIKTI